MGKRRRRGTGSDAGQVRALFGQSAPPALGLHGLNAERRRAEEEGQGLLFKPSAHTHTHTQIRTRTRTHTHVLKSSVGSGGSQAALPAPCFPGTVSEGPGLGRPRRPGRPPRGRTCHQCPGVTALRVAFPENTRGSCCLCPRSVLGSWGTDRPPGSHAPDRNRPRRRRALPSEPAAPPARAVPLPFEHGHRRLEGRALSPKPRISLCPSSGKRREMPHPGSISVPLCLELPVKS